MASVPPTSPATMMNTPIEKELILRNAIGNIDADNSDQLRVTDRLRAETWFRRLRCWLSEQLVRRRRGVHGKPCTRVSGRPDGHRSTVGYRQNKSTRLLLRSDVKNSRAKHARIREPCRWLRRRSPATAAAPAGLSGYSLEPEHMAALSGPGEVRRSLTETCSSIVYCRPAPPRAPVQLAGELLHATPRDRQAPRR